MAITTTLLLDAIKRGVTIPSNQVRFDDEDLLKFADEETESVILPMLTSIRQEFLVKTKTTACVSGTQKYKIPYRAVGRTLRDLKLARTSDTTFIKTLAYISPEDAASYTTTMSGEPAGFTVEGDSIKLLPTPNSSDISMVFYYLLKPSYLVATTSAGAITAINTTTGVVTIGTAVSTFATGSIMDFVDGKSGCSVKGEDLTNTNVSSTAITFAAADLPSDLAVGDYVTLSNQSPVLQIPDELHQSLVQAVICRILEALGDVEMYAISAARLVKMLDVAQQLLTPRVESELPVVLDRFGLLRQRPWVSRFRSNVS